MNTDTIIHITNALTINQIVGALNAVVNSLSGYTDPEVQELANLAESLAVRKQHEADSEVNIALALSPEVDIWQVRDSL